MRTVLYARVSTTEQTLDHQRAQAEAAGYVLDEVIADHGVSGVNTKLRERPEGRRLFDMLREGDTLLVRWIDRLGRNYQDVTDSIREFIRRGVIVKTLINGGVTFDGATKDPMQMAVRDALIGFLAATAQAQAEATKEAQRVAIDRTRAEREDAYRGRKPSFTRDQVSMVRDMLSAGTASIVEISKATRLSRGTVYRIKDDPSGTEALLAKWF